MLTMTDFLIPVAVVLLVIIVVDGIRRMRNASPRFQAKKFEKEQVKVDDYNAELPNGGARVLTSLEEQDEQSSVNSSNSSSSITEKMLAEREELQLENEPPQKIDLNKKVPVLMDSVEVEEPQVEDESSEQQGELVLEVVEEPEDVLMTGFDEHQNPEYVDNEELVDEQVSKDSDASSIDAESFESIDDNQEVIESNVIEPVNKQQETESAGTLEDSAADEYLYDDLHFSAQQDQLDDKPIEPVQLTAQAEPSVIVDADVDESKNEEEQEQDVIVINVMANQEFEGDHLLQLLLACGLRFGDMNIFHRHDDHNKLQFSLANSVTPGTFDVDNMNQFSTVGVALFLQLPCDANPMEAFDAMYETAQCIARNLDGQLKDEQQSALTIQTAEHCRERIRSFQRKELMPS